MGDTLSLCRSSWSVAKGTAAERLVQPGLAALATRSSGRSSRRSLPPGRLRWACWTRRSVSQARKARWGDFSITNFSRNEALEEAIVADVTAKLAVFVEWYETGGA